MSLVDVLLLMFSLSGVHVVLIIMVKVHVLKEDYVRAYTIGKRLPTIIFKNARVKNIEM